ncbi:MFS transporter [uncultured Mitsuokella sp.]|uniref:MFS transporter n=1 Tax=uncultured Mitsuokella sp. TaxID=453120 RepID=UPI002582F74B|nr:glycoside-pentoside-hexuronide (GPH):cation symporter [uncultured Mitsuokella sp.]
MTVSAPSASHDKLSWFTRIAYGLGDTAQNVVWGAMSILTFFYTDYAGVDPTIVGLVMLLSRCFDGVSDVCMGFIVEHTHSRWGKARPWILWMSVPFAISIVLLYLVPQGSSALQFAYIFVTYNFCTTVCYTAMNLPYGSLSAMMTHLSKERDMLSITRMTLSPLGKILSVSATLPLIKLFGDTQWAWVEVMSIWALLALLLLLICFYKCEERVQPVAKKVAQKIPVKTALKALAYNRYFWMATGLWTMQACIALFTGTILPYYCKYIFLDDSLYSILFLVETFTTILATILFCPRLLKRFGKRNMSLYGIVLAFFGHLAYLLDPYSFNWVLFSCFIRGLCFAPLNSVIFGFFGDVVDYSQWKFHIRQEGLIFSGGSVGNKIGGGIVSALLTGLLSYAGYVSSVTASAVQPQSAINMIVTLYEYGPLIIWGIVIVILWCYKLDQLYPQIMRDLVRRAERGED